MKKIIIIILITFCFVATSFSQNYNTGIGLRAGYYNGLTIKHFLSGNTAFEGIISTRWQGVEVTGLYEIQNHITNAGGLDWFFGFGGHLGFWNGDHTSWGTPDKNYTILGIDGIIGLEYSFRQIPINIGIDWKPTLNLVGYTGFWSDGGAFSIRYIF
ncbi:MAG: hypothetical protein M0P26_05340 [Bacteroidales bacterium]|nr:hypothetical protein [Bacteroidales bacterium]